ncbi:hypothetical protein JW935_17830 [candidate division KSB1 bacterium]|nr:hypothetical protein [candidate division KSB1 bacterium]
MKAVIIRRYMPQSFSLGVSSVEPVVPTAYNKDRKITSDMMVDQPNWSKPARWSSRTWVRMRF